ncbi:MULTISPECIES: YitT family protein [Hymenobacter]|uniref:YitT family protein n=1 Tax=Hymenobacter profundi TaxID=1982110 RepID=A0ABS6X8F0_9BACT|nr:MULTISPECIES: YitT family protein [Hymenobacter]MBW3131204.1 YitT family protein [Hymenobacter profundi]QNE40407.1 YitT family protein [Hymenobacter sp. NBH84]
MPVKPTPAELQNQPKGAAATAATETIPPHEDEAHPTVYGPRWWRKQVVQGLMMVAGIFSAALGLESFLLPNGFIDGGVTGISLLTNHTTHLSLPLLIVVLNIPFVVMGYFQLGRGFAARTLAAILGLATVLYSVHFSVLAEDKLLAAVFGGFFLGSGIGLAVRGGAVLDGTEILAVYLSKKLPLTVGDIILLINIVIFGVAALLLSITTALYSILAYLAAAKMVDFIIEGIEEYTGVTIISPKSEAIRRMVTEKLGRGATLYVGKSGYNTQGQDQGTIDIIFTLVTRLEVTRLTDEIDKIDPNAFVVMSSVRDTKGGMVKRRPLH